MNKMFNSFKVYSDKFENSGFFPVLSVLFLQNLDLIENQQFDDRLDSCDVIQYFHSTFFTFKNKIKSYNKYEKIYIFQIKL